MYLKSFKTLSAQSFFFLTCLFYAFSINLCHKTYLFERQEFWGFTYFGLSDLSYYIIFFSILITSFNIPLKLSSPSKFITFILYIVVYIPTIVLTLALKENSLGEYSWGLFCLSTGFIILSLLPKLNFDRKIHLKYFIPDRRSEYFFLALWVFCFTMLLYLFKDIINFVGLEDIYGQRAAGRSRNLFEGYMQTYLPNVICAALMTFGLIFKKWSYIIMAIAGYLLMFGITAQRTVFMMPLVLFALFKYLKDGTYNEYSMIRMVLFISTVFIIVAFLPNGVTREFLGFYFVTRIFATPGIMYSMYHDTFSQISYTYWSHVKGINLFVSKPVEFNSDADWPQLGWIVARYKLGIISNSNANLFAADGVAAASGIGVIIICIILALYLLVFDKVTKNIDPRFKVMVAFPIGLALTNGSLATILLSFGGVFWIAFFLFVGKREIDSPNE